MSSNTPLDPKEQRLAAKLKALPMAGPSAALDARVRAAARSAVAQAPAARRRYWPLGGIAAALLAVAIALPLVDHELLRAPPAPAVSQPAESSIRLPDSAGAPAPASLYPQAAPVLAPAPFAAEALEATQDAKDEQDYEEVEKVSVTGSRAKRVDDVPADDGEVLELEAPTVTDAAKAEAAPATSALGADRQTTDDSERRRAEQPLPAERSVASDEAATALGADRQTTDGSERRRAEQPSPAGRARAADEAAMANTAGASPPAASPSRRMQMPAAPALAQQAAVAQADGQAMTESAAAEDPAAQIAALLVRYQRGERDELLEPLRTLRAAHPDLELPTELKALLDAEAAGRR